LVKQSKIVGLAQSHTDIFTKTPPSVCLPQNHESAIHQSLKFHFDMRIFTFAAIILLFAACQAKPKTVQDIEKEELATGKRYDDLFLDLKFGMSPKQFYDICWDLNKQQILREGKGNTAAMMELKKGELKLDGNFYFYPRFENDKIVEMPFMVNYDAWSPWNPEAQSDKLIIDVKNMLRKWYPDGMDFYETKDAKGYTIFVKVDGNRKITLTAEDVSEVRGSIIDIASSKKM
jgi:hypothetical protein